MGRICLRVVACTLVAFAANNAPALAQNAECNIAILNGRVMDPETKFDGVRNVCVKGHRIAKITKDKITGKETINAKGHVVVLGSSILTRIPLRHSRTKLQS